MRLARPVVASAAALAIGVFGASAHADEQRTCVAASEKAQQLRNAGKLSEAREQLTICGRAECPKLVQQDCTEWMRELLGSLPSVVPGAKDKNGRDLVDVRVSVDGKVMTETLDGKPIALDPGVHRFRFETKNAPPVDEQIVVKQGEKNRIINVTFATPEDKHVVGPSPPITNKGKDPPYLAYVFAGLGVAVGAVALVVDLGANSDARTLRGTCAPNCKQADVDDIDKRYTLAGVTAGIGGALFLTGVVLFVVHVTSDSGGRSSALRSPSIVPRPGGAGAVFEF